MIRKSGHRFSLATNAERVCAEIMLKQKSEPAMDIVRVLSTLALKGAVPNLAARYEAQSGARIDADFAPTLALLERLRGGEAADVVILTREGLGELAAEGTVVSDSRAELARSDGSIGVEDR